ncbi:MAG: hypothetical protein JKY37_02665 [Nannocystaceae bacterium]|nr:hypothetical protein [Nannocystaceae bacterium]
MPAWVKVVLLAAAPVVLGWAATATGVLPMGSKYTGALWAFSPIVAYQLTSLRARWILAAFVMALAGNHIIVAYVLLPAMPATPGASVPLEVMAITATLMMSAACGLGFLVGHSTRRKQHAAAPPPSRP